MNELLLKKYGRTLTDRFYGKQVAEKLLKEESFPVILNFEGVISLGSSFGDEIIIAIAKKQGDRITVLNANKSIELCLSKIAEDIGVTIEF